MPAPVAHGMPGFLPPQPGSASPGVLSGVGRLDSAQVADQTAYSQRANGKLFFVQGPYRYQCSASVVPSRENNVILTAGHCVYDWESGGFSKKLFFVPAYRGRTRPYGTWGWRAEIVPRQWFRSMNSNYDYAAIAMRPNSRGKVGNVVGELGVMWNYGRGQQFRAIGYPSNFGRGHFMWQCLSGLFGQDGARFSGPPAMAINCDMGPGSSGGGWEINTDDDWYVASVTSHGYRGRPNALYGPYFTREVADIITRVQR